MLAGGGGAFWRRLLAAFSWASLMASAEASLASAAPGGGVPEKPLDWPAAESALTTDSVSADVKTLGFAGTGERRFLPVRALSLEEELPRRRLILRL
mmetsp:Transcript_8210/g.19519  ORF Transcript_8210/g.19519 Transcript_8210/m.19519 type:complete len:97 (+) Transcript_8210:223-513(+)